MQRAAYHVRGAIQRGEHLGRADGVSLRLHIAPMDGGGGLLSRQGGGSHLTAGHAVIGIVQKEHGDVLAARSSVHDLCHANGGQVAIALVGHHNAVGQHTLDAGSHGRGTSVRCLHKVKVKIVVGKNRAAH